VSHMRYRCTRDRQVSRQTLHIRLTSFSPPNSSTILLLRPRSGLPFIQPKLLLMVEMRLLCVTERKSKIVSKAEGLDDRYREVELATGYRAGSFARERCAEMEQHASLLAVGI
jgi:hypothetical protein